MDNDEPKTGVNIEPDGRRWWVPRLKKAEDGTYLDASGRPFPPEEQAWMREYEESLHDPSRYLKPPDKIF